jgi:TonB family protein
MKLSHLLVIAVLSCITSCANAPKKGQNPDIGMVVVRFVVSETGEVEEAAVESSTNTAFNQSALDGVRKWKFKPGIKDGRPVKVAMRVPIVFQLDGNPKSELSVQPQKIDSDNLSVPTNETLPSRQVVDGAGSTPTPK